jgi:hypothetical protein
MLREDFAMTNMNTAGRTEPLDGIYLRMLHAGSVIDLATQSRHYRIEYVGGDKIRISGHPKLCPTPILAQLEGSARDSGTFEPGFLGRGMRLVFRRENGLAVTTSRISDITLTATA